MAHGEDRGRLAESPAPTAAMLASSFHRSVLLLVLALFAGGCATRTPSTAWVRSEVYFGLHRPDGGAVSATEWQAFVNEIVTPKFPSGLTIVDSVGQWRHANGRIESEPSKVVVLLHPSNSRAEADIDEIRQLYCQRFAQEAVMKVTSPARVAF